MFVMETCPVFYLMYLVLPDASKAILSGKSKRRSMSLGYKHCSPHDHRAFGNEHTTVPWARLTTFAPQSVSVWWCVHVGPGSL
jgi:hypothetical protein